MTPAELDELEAQLSACGHRGNMGGRFKALHARLIGTIRADRAALAGLLASLPRCGQCGHTATNRRDWFGVTVFGCDDHAIGHELDSAAAIRVVEGRIGP